MDNRSKIIPQNKIKRSADLEVQTSRATAGHIGLLTHKQDKCVLHEKPLPKEPIILLRPDLKPQLIMRPNSQPLNRRKGQTENQGQPKIYPTHDVRPKIDNASPYRSLPDDRQTRRHPENYAPPCRMQDDQLMQSPRRPANRVMFQLPSQGDNVPTRCLYKDYAPSRCPAEPYNDHHHRARAATAAAAAAAATAVAQFQRTAIDAMSRQQSRYMNMAGMRNTPAPPFRGVSQSEQRRVNRNSNLLSSALSIIREMDPSFLETLCYAIHDQVTKGEPNE